MARPSTVAQIAHPVVVRTAPPRRGVLGTLVQAVALLVLVALLLALVSVGLLVASFAGVGSQIAGSGGQVQHLVQTVGDAGRRLLDTADPAHPPTGLVYDTEFNSLRVIAVGSSLGDAQAYDVRLQSIERRSGANSPDTALYAVVHAQLRHPRETRLLGQVIRTDSDPHDWVLYKGESFQIGANIYRVNWISQEEQSMAVAAYRHPDAVTGALKFSYK